MDQTQHAFITLSAETHSPAQAASPAFALDCPYCSTRIEFSFRDRLVIEYGSRCSHINGFAIKDRIQPVLMVEFKRD